VADGSFAGWHPPPDAFSVVMATGIVAIAGYDHGYWRVGIALTVLAVVAFGVLAAIVLRLVATRRPRIRALTREPGDPLRMFAFVAACAVLGVRFNDHLAAVWLLGALALVAWLGLLPLALVAAGSRSSVELREQARGAWLLPSVATAGLAVTAADLAIHLHSAALVAIATAAWIVGMVLYLAVTGLIIWRVVAIPLRPDEVTPDSWILMGALAITALAGDHILTAARTLRAPAGLAHWTGPVTHGAWALASLWIPVLLYAQLWRADQVAGSLRYQSAWWAAVFPLGMYATTCAATATELHIRSLRTVSLVFFWIACTVWALVTAGGLRCALRRISPTRSSPPRSTTCSSG
jgi:tellurite resistance protein TehA-like permease